MEREKWTEGGRGEGPKFNKPILTQASLGRWRIFIPSPSRYIIDRPRAEAD